MAMTDDRCARRLLARVLAGGFRLPKREELVGTKGRDGKWPGVLPTLIAKLAGKEDDKMRVSTVTFKA